MYVFFIIQLNKYSGKVASIFINIVLTHKLLLYMYCVITKNAPKNEQNLESDSSENGWILV
jgi:hypothetical protein